MSRTVSLYPIPEGEQARTVVGHDGTRLFVHAFASSAPKPRLRVYLQDGILCDGFIWRYLWDAILPIADVTHWHYRGHGRSAAPVDEDAIGVEAHAEDLMAIRRDDGDVPCVLIGHSMGTQVCLENFRRYPRNVVGLVLLSGSYGKITHTFRGLPVLEMVLPRIIDFVGKRENVVRALWSRLPPELAFKMGLRAGEFDASRIKREDMLPYLRNMTQVDMPMFLRMLAAAGRHTAEDILHEIDVPTLVIGGEKDTFTPGWLSEKMAGAIPGAKLVMCQGASHVAPIEQPELVNGAIVEFLQSLHVPA